MCVERGEERGVRGVCREVERGVRGVCREVERGVRVSDSF